jgi:predicted Zn-dependent protease
MSSNSGYGVMIYNFERNLQVSPFMCIAGQYKTNCLQTGKLLPAAMFLIIFLLFQFYSVGIVSASFSIEDEKRLGKEFYEKLEKSQVLIRNEKVNVYITKLGQKVLLHSQKAPFNFRFFVIKSSAINAFATPGGYVYINRGLINLVDKESELAGILAHEIAHVNARHIASIIEKSQKVGIATLAAILAGAFLGGGTEVAAAVTSFSLATATSLNLKYSREHEEEADRLGLSYLVSTGYDGAAMLDFLKTMRRYEFYSNSVPSYFLTHPGTDERIRYLDAAIQTTYSRKGSDSIVGNLKRIQTILMFGEINLEVSLHHFQNELNKNPRDVDALYGLAVIQEKLGRASESLETFQIVLAISPADDDILRDLGILYFKLGRSSEAIYLFRKALALEANRDNVDVLLYMGRAYEAMADYQSALDIYRILEKKNIDDADIYYNIAMSYGKINDLGNSHYNFGVYFKKKKRFDSASFHFKEALKYFPERSEKYQEVEKELNSLSSLKKYGKENVEKGSTSPKDGKPVRRDR